MARFDTALGNIVTAMRATDISGRAAAIRTLHENARRAENAWPGYTPLVPPPNGVQDLTMKQLIALAMGPNT